jgi:urease accessory protein
MSVTIDPTAATPGLALTRLLQLASPALPVGAYSYSQGLEWAVEAEWIDDLASAREWIEALLEHGVGRFDAPLVACLHAAWSRDDRREVARLNDEHVASRESAELRAETLQMGYSLARLLAELPGPMPRCDIESPAFPTLFAMAAASWSIPVEATVTGYLWTWCENQTMAAVKLVPLGQTAGQRLLHELGARLPAIAARALTLPEDEWCNFAPRFAIACSRHETQYTRLFRS